MQYALRRPARLRSGIAPGVYVHYFARMVKKKLAFVFGVFCATVLLMAVQKPVFLAYYAADAAQASAGEWLGVVWHGLTLDSTVAGYVTALPLLLTLASLWVRLPERIWRRVLNVYFVLIAVLTAAIFAVDVELCRHWGFRLDSTVLIYLADPKEAKASVSADASEERATSLVSMTKSDKERLTAIAKAHGLSLSAFFRLAADEYIANHEW